MMAKPTCIRHRFATEVAQEFVRTATVPIERITGVFFRVRKTRRADKERARVRAIGDGCRSGRPACRIAAILPLLLLAACAREAAGPEQQIRDWVRAMQDSAEAKDRSGLIDGISPSYVDARGNTRDDIDKRLRLYFFRADRIALLPHIDEINIIGETAAEVSVTVGMARTKDSLLGIGADAYRFELELEQSDSEWKLISARWGELGQNLK